MRDTDYEDLLLKQLAMNRHTWCALERHGITEQSSVRLDFSYNAPSSDAADALREILLEQTDYDVRIETKGSFLHREWRVEGTTQETMISPAILDQWVRSMITAGKEWACDFEGWGTSV
jgi:hypothetical protein